MKRSALISDVEYEGSRAPHLKSIIKASELYVVKSSLILSKAVGK